MDSDAHLSCHARAADPTATTRAFQPMTSTLNSLQKILGDTLQIGPRAASLTRADRLLGAIPEFDSMAVLSIVTMIEERFGITIDDDDLSAEVFETLGSLTDFVDQKLGH